MTENAEDLRSLVHEGDVLAACRAMLPTVQSLLEYRAERMSVPIPGFTSLMLRVTAKIRTEDLSTSEVKMIYKRTPTITKQLEVMGGNLMFEREVAFYRDAVPLLCQRCSQPGFVKCYFSQGTTIIVEDLSVLGYKSIVPQIKDILDNVEYLSLDHARLAVRHLAHLHAASLDIDWTTLLPHLKIDPFYDTIIAESFHPKMNESARMVAIAIQEYMDKERYAKHIEWLMQGKCYELLSRLCRYVPGKLNVLCHGDFHANNMMFRLDEITDKPSDVKFFDLQIFRYAPPSRDLLYYLYCTHSELRKRHEKEILRTYVEAFNAATCTTPDRLPLEEFLEEYEASRMFGIGIAVTLRPLMFQSNLVIENEIIIGNEITEDTMDAMFSQEDSSCDIASTMKSKPQIKEVLLELAEEVVQVMDDLKLL